jgi:hypothetical protein
MTEDQAEDKEREQQVAFEKARFEYCAKLYERETERKETLEKKSQFLLSVITLFLGAMFLKLDFLETLRELIVQKSISATLIWSIDLSVIALALSLLISLIAVLQSMRLQRFKNEYPANIVSSLFAPNSKYLEGENEPSFLRATAMSYAIALEFNSRINDRKAMWVKISWFGVLAAAISLAAFLSLFAYISML